MLTWACTDNRLAAIAPFYGAAPKPRKAIRRMCPVVGSWPDKDFTTKAAGVLETELTAAGIPHDLKVYPGPSTPSSTTSGAPITPPQRPTPGSGPGLFRRACPGRAAVLGLRSWPGYGPGRGVLQAPLHAGPDSALHAGAQWPEQRVGDGFGPVAAVALSPVATIWLKHRC